MTTKTCTKCGKTYPATTEYFNKNHTCKNGLVGQCKVCRKKYLKKYREENKERIKKYLKKYREENREYFRSCSKKHYQENTEYYKKNFRKWKEENHEYHLKYNKNWRKNNPDKVRANSHRRRTLKLNAIGDHTEQDIERLKQKQDNKCLYCNNDLSEYHVDHFIPLSKGGRNSPDNLVIACPNCNLSKCSILPEKWNKWNGKYPVEWYKKKHSI